MKYPQQKTTWEGYPMTFTWMQMENLEGISPIMQVYGICFNQSGEILVARKSGKSHWAIPGGHPEGTETIQETLIREMIEEADVKIKNIHVVGVQQVDFPNNPRLDEGELFFQARCVCEVDELLPQTPDPDGGHLWERMFVPQEKVTEYVEWGVTGDAMFNDAIKLYKKLKSS